ncbi:MAG: response regulator transcription factor [Bacteroidota bacterium]
MSEVRLFIADAAYLVREGIKSVISDYGHLKVVGEAAFSEKLHQEVERTDPNIVIIDYHAPGIFSIEDIFELKARFPRIEILVISSQLVKAQVLRVLSFGAKGYLLKACDETEIIGAIHAVAKGDKFFCGKVLDIILERSINPTEALIEEENCDPTRLSQRETEIVKLMAEGLPAQEIANSLSLSVHTIYTHRKNIMQKLGVNSAAEVILYAINTSLVKP